MGKRVTNKKKKESKYNMRKGKSNLVEVRRLIPARNIAVFNAIVPENLTSTSVFSKDSIIIDELVSTTHHCIIKKLTD